VYRPDGVVTHHEGRSEGRGDHVAHSWLTLRERWEGRLPADESAILAEDGWEVVREQGRLRLRRLAPATGESAGRLRRRAEELMARGEFQEARRLLEEALAERRCARPAELRSTLLELELRVGNLAAAQRWAGSCRPRPGQQERLAQLRHDLRRRLDDYGIRADH